MHQRHVWRNCPHTSHLTLRFPLPHRHNHHIYAAPMSSFFVAIFSFTLSIPKLLSHFTNSPISLQVSLSILCIPFVSGRRLVFRWRDDHLSPHAPPIRCARKPFPFPRSFTRPSYPPHEWNPAIQLKPCSPRFKSPHDSHESLAPQGGSHSLGTQPHQRPPRPAVAQDAQGRHGSQIYVTPSIVCYVISRSEAIHCRVWTSDVPPSNRWRNYAIQRCARRTTGPCHYTVLQTLVLIHNSHENKWCEK